MEYLKAWIWKEHERNKKGEDIDETLLKYVEKMYTQLELLLKTKLVKRTESGNFELAELSDAQVENRVLKDICRTLLSTHDFYLDINNWNGINDINDDEFVALINEGHLKRTQGHNWRKNVKIQD